MERVFQILLKELTWNKHKLLERTLKSGTHFKSGMCRGVKGGPGCTVPPPQEGGKWGGGG